MKMKKKLSVGSNEKKWEWWLYDKDVGALKYNLMPVLPVDVNMKTSEDDNDNNYPPPIVHFVHLVTMKCVHLLATTDILDRKGKGVNHRADVVVVLNRFFLTKCELYLPDGVSIFFLFYLLLYR